MISALQKVAGHTHLEAPQSMRAMFLEDDDEGIMGLFATHPPVEKRVQRLIEYSGGRRASEAPPVATPDASSPWGARPGGTPGPWS